jgi:hypothetical protein
MAYTQNPGRGNKSKTGSGIPSPLRQDVEPTERYVKGKKKYLQNAEKGYVHGGISVDPATGVAVTKPYENKLVKRGNQAFIIGGDNRTIARATDYGQGREIEQLEKRFKADSTNTMNQRNLSAEFFNANSGGTSWENLTPKQKQMLKELRKTSPAKQKKKMAPAKMKKC